MAIGEFKGAEFREIDMDGVNPVAVYFNNNLVYSKTSYLTFAPDVSATDTWCSPDLIEYPVIPTEAETITLFIQGYETLITQAGYSRSEVVELFIEELGSSQQVSIGDLIDVGTNLDVNVPSTTEIYRHYNYQMRLVKH